MRIGITQKQLPTEYGGTIDVLESEYTLYYPQFGITLVPISNVLEDPVTYAKEMDVEGFIFTGGNGVMPQLFSEEVTFSNKFSKDRERTEKLLLGHAIQARLPVLGVCRGLHYMNVHFGGKLIQNMTTISTLPHVAKDHQITLVDKHAKEHFGSDTILTNSFHNQGITKATLAPALIPFAVCADETIEAAYHKELPIAGVTWHPERKSPDALFNEKLIQAFVNRELYWKA